MESWLDVNEASFYAASWSLGFLVALFRTLADSADISLRIALASSGVVGFLAFSAVGLLVGGAHDGAVSGHWYYLALSALIGLAGPYQQRIVRRLLQQAGISIEGEGSDKQ